MNNYTDEVNAKKAVKDKIDAVNKAISDLEKEKFTLADASEEDAKKAEVDLEISKINQLIAAYKAEAAKQLRLKS